MNSLHLAVSRNHVNIVEMLLDSDFPMDLETIDGMTAFQLAAYHGHSTIITKMINYLKRVDNPDFIDLILNKVNPRSNLSTLAYAILNCGDGGAKGAIKQAEKGDAKAVEKQKQAATALAEQQQAYLEISKELIEFGACSYYNETDEQKDFSPIFMAVQKEHQDLLELMCDHGISLTVKNSVGMTPLMFAAEQNYQIIVNYLSLRTRDLNEEDSNSITILVHQLFSGNMKMASRLIVRGAQIDYVNRNGQTALHLCVANKLTEAVEFLLFKGANPHIMDLEGEDACDKAKANGLARGIPEFNNCNIRKKLVPMLPNGRHADVKELPLFKKQLAFTTEHRDVAFEYQVADDEGYPYGAGAGRRVSHQKRRLPSSQFTHLNHNTSSEARRSSSKSALKRREEPNKKQD